MKNIILPTSPKLQINGFSFRELFQAQGLARLDETFLSYLKEQDANLQEALLAYRLDLKLFPPKELSTLLIDCARYLEAFIGELFNIEEAVKEAQLAVLSNDPVFLFKQWFVLREAKRKLSKAAQLPDFETLTAWNCC
jgi:hypothetical protein